MNLNKTFIEQINRTDDDEEFMNTLFFTYYYQE